MPKKVTCPNATFGAITTILETLKKSNRLTADELIKETNRSISWLNNAIPVMAELGLVYRGYDEKIIGITNKGNKLIELIEKKDNEELKEFGEEIYKQSEILRITRKIITDEPDVKIAELGKQIADGLNIPKDEQWINETTYVVVARSCKSILGGLQLIDYQPMKYTRSNVNRFKNKLMPYASTVLLDKLLMDFENGFYEIKKDIFNQYQRQRKTDYFNCAIMLELIERIPGDRYSYKITSDGKKLREAKGFSEHAKIFQEILLKNPHFVEMLKTLKNNYDEISAEEMGSIVSDYNKSNWGTGSKKSYGNNFMNWLVESDIMIKRGRKHKYTFQPHFFESDNYKRFIENEYDISVTIEKESEVPAKTASIEKNQAVKLLHKTPSLEELNNEGLLKEVICEIAILLCNKVEKWDKNQSSYLKIIDIYDKLSINAEDEYPLISSASSDFDKGYKTKDMDLLRNAQKINTYLLKKERVKR